MAGSVRIKASPGTSTTFLGVPDVPRIGLGLAALGRPGYINLGHGGDIKRKTVDQMRAQCWDVLDSAYAAGVRYFDAARSYGRAEEFLGGWLKARGIAPGTVAVGSKWGYYYTADWQTDTGGAPHEIKEHTAQRLAVQQQETLGHLGEYLQLYQIHSATLDSGVLQAPDVLAGLEQLKKERGWRIGLSLSGVGQSDTLRVALGVRMSCGAQLFDSVQATWNLLEQSAGAALAEAHALGLQVIIKEGVANGRLTARCTLPQLASRVAVLRDTAQALGTTPDALALAAVVAQPFQPMVLSGATTQDQLTSNLGALDLSTQLSPNDLSALCTALVQPPAEYWAQRAALTWN